MTMVASPINSFTYRNDSDTSIQLTTCSTLVTVELPKFRKSLSELESVGDKMMYCFRYQSTFNSIPKELQCPELEKLFGISNFASLTENEQNMYMREFKEKMDRLSELHTAECKGLEKGRAEANLQMAKDMKQKNLPVSLISELTHLSVEEIERL
ncbi:MAG: PD-(D/E)XK nuclease family transposase [Bacteroidaceae bacterium]|nr:PD-(D/E)XK nuclease family transposase [Bacteroidaceae bacterium]